MKNSTSSTSPSPLTLFSPAKINLFLRIISKKSDGYHHLSSVFQTISLGDHLTIELDSKSDSESHFNDFLSCSDPSLPTDDSNLILKAVKLFRKKTGCRNSFKIHLEKRIPIQAGLGGGSSNAATTLWGCNQLTNGQISVETLMQWGGELGSDVPFFFSQGTAFCSGRGERVKNLPFFPSFHVWIVKPSFGLSTPEVYRQLNFTDSLNQSAEEGVLKQDLEAFLCRDCKSFHYFNDLEKSAFALNPSLEKLKTTLLNKGFDVVLMSGSGSAFFCLTTKENLEIAHLLNDFDLREEGSATLYSAQCINRPSSHWFSS